MSAINANFQMAVSRYRGNTAPEEFQLVDNNGNAIDITDRSFILTVNPASNPVDNTNDVYELTGVITNASNGLYRFPISQTQADSAAAGEYFFDIKMTYDPGTGDVTKTIAAGTWTIIQGIS